MTYEGTVQNGVVVLAGGQTLPEGTVVQVLPRTKSPEDAKEDPQAIWQDLARLGREVESLPCDLPSDLAKNHDHYLYGAPKRP